MKEREKVLYERIVIVIWIIKSLDISCLEKVVDCCFVGENVWMVIIENFIIFVKNIIKLICKSFVSISDSVISIQV